MTPTTHLFDSFLDLIRIYNPTQKTMRPIVSVNTITETDAIFMTLGGIPMLSHRGLNPTSISGRVKVFIATSPNNIYATNFFAIINYLS